MGQRLRRGRCTCATHTRTSTPASSAEHLWPVGVDHPPAGALDHAAYRREHAYLRDSVLPAARRPRAAGRSAGPAPRRPHPVRRRPPRAYATPAVRPGRNGRGNSAGTPRGCLVVHPVPEQQEPPWPSDPIATRPPNPTRPESTSETPERRRLVRRPSTSPTDGPQDSPTGPADPFEGRRRAGRAWASRAARPAARSPGPPGPVGQRRRRRRRRRRLRRAGGDVPAAARRRRAGYARPR